MLYNELNIVVVATSFVIYMAVMDFQQYKSIGAINLSKVAQKTT